MITVIKTKDGFERLAGNPVLKSLDGKRKTRLRMILHESWTPKERAAYGIYLAEPFVAPKGKRAIGSESFEEAKDGTVRQVFDVEDAPEPKQRERRNLAAEFDALKARVAALEGKG